MVLLWAALIVIAVVFAVTLELFHMGVNRYGGKWARKVLHYGLCKISPSETLVREGSDAFFALDPENVHIESFDGLSLSAYFLPAENPKRTVLLSHCYRGRGVDNFAPFLGFYHDSGCNILVIDHRAHGKSEGKYIGFGLLERFDCLSWVEYLNSRLGSGLPIYMIGVSMGSSVLTMASALPFPSNVKGIVADCGYTSPWEEISYILRRFLHLPVFPFLYVGSLFCRLTMGAGLRSVSSAGELSKTKIPVMFIHGEADILVPQRYGRINFEACASEKRFESFENAPHGFSSVTDPERYRALLLDFFAETESAFR